MSEPKFLQDDVKDSLPVVANAIRFREQLVLQIGPSKFG